LRYDILCTPSGAKYNLEIFVLLYSEVIGTRTAQRRHSDLEKQGGVHGDVMYSKLSLDATLVWRSLCLSLVRSSKHGVVTYIKA